MGAIGKVGSFATDSPLTKNYIGEAMETVDAIAFRNRQEQLAKAKLKKDEDDVKLKELEEYNAKFGVNITGNQSIDDTTTNYAMQAKQQANELTKQIQMTTDFNKKSELMGRRAKIVQSFDILKQIPNMLIAQGKEIADGVESGKYNADDVNLIQEKFKALEQGKVHYYADDAGNLRFTTYKVDESGNPTGIIDKDQTVAELIKSTQPHLASKYDAILKSAVDNTAVKETEIQNGLTTITNKGVAKEVADSKALAFGNMIANNPAEAYALGKRHGIDPSNKEEIAKLAADEFKKSLDYTYKKKVDLTEGRLQREADKKEEKAQITVVETPPSYGEKGIKPMQGYKTVSVVGGKPIQQIVGYDSEKGGKVTFDTAFLNSYTVTKNPKTGGRAIVAEITYPDYKSAGYSKEEQDSFKVQLANATTKEEADLVLSKATKPISYKTEVSYLTEKDASKYLKTIGAKSVSDMADKARVSEEAKTQAQWNAEWSRLKKGESMIGLDGKTYTKS